MGFLYLKLTPYLLWLALCPKSYLYLIFISHHPKSRYIFMYNTSVSPNLYKLPSNSIGSHGPWKTTDLAIFRENKLGARQLFSIKKCPCLRDFWSKILLLVSQNNLKNALKLCRNFKKLSNSNFRFLEMFENSFENFIQSSLGFWYVLFFILFLALFSFNKFCNYL